MSDTPLLGAQKNFQKRELVVFCETQQQLAIIIDHVSDMCAQHLAVCFPASFTSLPCPSIRACQNEDVFLRGQRYYGAVEGCHIFGFLPLRCFLGRGVGYHERNEFLFNRNSSLQETCADALDCDAALASLFNDLFYRQSSLIFLLSAVDPTAIPAKIDAVSRYDDFESSVPFDLLQSNNITTHCSPWYQQGVHVAGTVNAVDRSCANIERAERELVQPRPRPVGFVFNVGGLPPFPLPPSFFRANPLRHSLSSRCLPSFLPSFFRHVGCSILITPRLGHHRRFCLLTCPFLAFLLSSVRVPLFSRRRCTNFAAAGTVAVRNSFALLGYITTSRCCWQAYIVSINEFFHQSTPCRDIDLCELFTQHAE